MVELLNKHGKITRISAYSKRWWNKEVAEARQCWAKNKRMLAGDESQKQEFRQVHNLYYQTIRNTKRLSWQNFLQGKNNDSQQENQTLDQNQCWTVLKHTKPRQLKTMPTLKDPDGNIATSIKAKEDLVRKSAFPKPPLSLGPEPAIAPGLAYKRITEVEVAH